MDDDSSDVQEPAKLYLTRLRLALAPYTVHFQSPGYIKDETLRLLERDVVKKTLEESRRSFELRYAAPGHAHKDSTNKAVMNWASRTCFGMILPAS